MKTIEEINKLNVKKIIAEKKLPVFFPGDIIKIGVRITEGKRDRIQYFEGVCIAKKSRDINSSFTVRKISFGEGVERTFALIDAIVRLIPGVIGNSNSLPEETFEKNLLECPQYTKPQIWEKKTVPEVLLSGDHKKIKDWRLSQSEAITRDRRPDLWQKYKGFKKN